MNRSLAVLLTLALAACGSPSGGPSDPGPEAAPDVPADVADDLPADLPGDPGPDVLPDLPADLPPDAPPDAVPDVPPVVAPACDPASLAGPAGAALPLDDLRNPPSEGLPFPNLAQAKDDPASPTGLRLDYRDHLMAPLLSLLDGTGVTSPFVVALAGPPDPASLPPEGPGSTAPAAVFLVRTAGADEPTLDPGRLAAATVPARVAYNADAQALVVEPLAPLQERTPYALVVTRCLRDAEGRPVAPSPSVAALADAPVDTPLGREAGRALRFLARPDVNVPRESLAFVLPTVTRSASNRLRAALEALPGDPGPAVVDWALPPALPDGTLDPAFLAQVPGLEAFVLDQFPADQIADYDFGAVALAAGGHFAAKRLFDPVEGLRTGPEGLPADFGDQELRFFLTLPREDPDRGIVQPFPVVVFQHAFGVCKETSIALAGTFARMGLATVGIDAVAHGHRAAGGTWRCPADPTAFLTLGDPVRLWYNFAESAVDLAQLARRATDLGLDLYPGPGGDGLPDLRTGTVGLVGQSMGAFLGGVAMGVSDDVGPAVINVGGGQVGLFFAWGLVADSGLDPLDLSWSTLSGLALELMGPTQAAMDDVEPLVLAGDTLAEGGPQERQVLLQQAVEDDTVPLACAHRLARRMGVPRATPAFRPLPGVADAPAPLAGNLPGSRTGALAQFSPARHDFLLVNRWADRDRPLLFRAQGQAGHFLRTFFDSGVSTVADPYAAGVVDPWLPPSLRAP